MASERWVLNDTLWIWHLHQKNLFQGLLHILTLSPRYILSSLLFENSTGKSYQTILLLLRVDSDLVKLNLIGW